MLRPSETDALAADLRAARTGDLRAFQRLFERHAALVLRLVSSRLPSEPHPEIVAEEIWLAVWDALDELDDPLRWLPWLLARSRRVLEERHGDELLESDPEELPFLERLDEATREVVRLRYFLGLSFDAIALRLGGTHAAVSLALRRAKAGLRLKLGGSVRGHD
jgi:DNA-directed RNA polymerase specialized sigma24 family protein